MHSSLKGGNAREYVLSEMPRRCLPFVNRHGRLQIFSVAYGLLRERYRSVWANLFSSKVNFTGSKFYPLAELLKEQSGVLTRKLESLSWEADNCTLRMQQHTRHAYEWQESGSSLRVLKKLSSWDCIIKSCKRQSADTEEFPADSISLTWFEILFFLLGHKDILRVDIF